MAKSLTADVAEAAARRNSRARKADEIDNKQDDKSQSKQDDKERQTYYIPREKHRRLKMIALQNDINVSALAEEGIDHILKKYKG